MELIGFQYSATGVFGYTFYRNGSKICMVSSLVVPSPTVHIHGSHRDWMSPFDQESTIFPGLTRYVYRADSGQEECRIVYMADWYEIRIGTDVYCVSENDGEYIFSAGERQIADITKISRQEAEKISAPQDEPNYDVKAYYRVDAAEEIPENALMAILAFPMVRFGF